MNGRLIVGDCLRFVGSGEDIQDQIPADRSSDKSFCASLRYRLQTMGGYGREDRNKLAIAFGTGPETFAGLHQWLRKIPRFKRSAVTQSTGLLLENGKVVSGLVKGLVATELTTVRTDQFSVVNDRYLISIRTDSDGLTHRAGLDAIAIAVKVNQ